MMKQDVALAYVDERTKKGTIFVEVKLDRAKAVGMFAREAASKANGGYMKMHVYIVESLATNIREYKTLRMCEFYGLS
jgi:hypothetical protein